VRLVEEVAAPATIQEATAFMKRRPDCVPWAGGTVLSTDDDAWPQSGPVPLMDIRNLTELKGINRSSVYVEIGSAATLNAIIRLPGGLGLGMLRETCLSAGTAFTRNLATLGGNLCTTHRFMSCMPVLYCMDASLELREHGAQRWYGLGRLVDENGKPRPLNGALLTRVRIPQASWSTWAVRPIGTYRYPHPQAATFAAAARFEHGALAELRIASAGSVLVRERAIELSLVGKKLPLQNRDVEDFAQGLLDKAIALGSAGDFAERIAGLAAAFLDRAPEEAL